MNRATSSNNLALLSDGPVVSSDRVETELGWTLKPEGLCRDDVCIPVPDVDALGTGGQIDLRVVADILDRPILVDEPTQLVAIGAPRHIRRRALDDLHAPDFTLPDLEGTEHSLSDHRSKKKLLIAFSSW